MWLFRLKSALRALQARLVASLGTAASLLRRTERARLPERLALLGGVIIGLAICCLTVMFLWPRSIAFSFASSTCFANPTFLPGLMHQSPNHAYAVAPSRTIRIAGHIIYAHSACITPVAAPRPSTAERMTLKLFGAPLLRKNIQITTRALPTVSTRSMFTKPIATDRPLVFMLSSADRVFTYRLGAEGRTVPCTTMARRLSCNTSLLQLAQSSNYTLSLERLFKGRKQATVLTKPATTVGAVQLVSSSVADDATVHDIPTHFSFTFNKPIKSQSGVQLDSIAPDGTHKRVTTTVKNTDKTIDIALDAPLPRQTRFEIRIASVTAEDGGHLTQPLTISFTTSGGPKVKDVSIGNYKVGTGDNIRLTFDTAVSGSQNLGDYIRLEVGGGAVPAALTRSDNHVLINPAADLPHCTRFSVKVLDGLQNEFGVAGDSAWSFNSRTICQTTFSIGKSVQNRSITAYRFGSGSSLIIYAGNIHGNEKSARYTLDNWVDSLERNYDKIPGSRTIVVIPNLNPDGFAANSRTNAHGIDLNRNFATANWKQSITMPGGTPNTNGGGSSPLSEPESSAFANYIAGSHPRLVLTYHAAAGIVQPNDAGDSDALAKTYDQKSNLDYSPASQNEAIFDYDTTGSFEDWAHEKHNTPVLLIELYTKDTNEFSKNQAAMWQMATL